MRKNQFLKYAPLILCVFCLFFMQNEKIYAEGAASVKKYTLKVKTDKENALYTCHEKIIFNVSLTDRGKLVPGKPMKYSIMRDGTDEIINGDIVSSEIPSKIETVMENPGFVLISVSFTDENERTLVGLGGAGVDPFAIKPGFKADEDFDSFWNKKKDELDKLPVEIKMTPATVPPALAGKIECFDVKINCTGNKPVSGYFARPFNAEKRALPAIVIYHAAGVDSAQNLRVCTWAAKGMLALDINAHGIENGHLPEYYKHLANTIYNGYPHWGENNREKSYFLGMFQRVYRSLQFIKKQPEWDSNRLISYGSSQGGGQAIVAAGLDPQVTLCVAFVPALCDHYGYRLRRHNGWPQFMTGKLPEKNIEMTAMYFDGVNFASRTKAMAIFTVGFVDTTCCPAAIYATYNNFQGEKQIINNPLTGHCNPAEVTLRVDKMIMEYIKNSGRIRDYKLSIKQ